LSSFDRAITLFTPAERALIRAHLQTWSIDTGLGRIIVPNLNSLEHFLPPEEMAPLLDVLLTWDGVDSLYLEKEYRQACYLRVRRGGEVKNLPSGVLLGRAVERPMLESYLEERYFYRTAFFGSFDQIKDFVNRLCLGLPLSSREAGLMLAEFSMWATWEQGASATDPFAFAADDALQIRACIGLQKRLASLELLLMIYQKPAGLSLCRPTVADAELHPHFQPPPKGFKNHGWTRPWSTDLVDWDGGRPVPRPECVHEAIPIGALNLPVRIAKR
jgi:hypothetical protein